MSDIEIIVNRDGVQTVTALISNAANQIETLRFIKIISPEIERLHLAARKGRKVRSDR
jgi:hypothetical protein